jgi:hypothetical protein
VKDIFDIQLWPNNIVDVLFMVLSWGLLVGIVLYYYRREKEAWRPVFWKALLIAFVCVFAFTLNIPLGEYMGRFAILPLGVWVVYWAAKNKSWPRYRRYAWIGFWCNYVFLAAGLLGHYVNEGVYPKQTISTYFANVENARLVAIHPSAPEASLDAARLEQSLKALELQPEYDAMTWGYESRDAQTEWFPYALLGTEASWGSGISAEVYVQADGKGLLVAWNNRYLYYKAPSSLLSMESGGGSE